MNLPIIATLAIALAVSASMSISTSSKQQKLTASYDALIAAKDRQISALSAIVSTQENTISIYEKALK